MSKKTLRKKVVKDPALKARQIAEKAKPNMRVVEVAPLADEFLATPDATVPDMEHVQKKYGVRTNSDAGSSELLHMVTMEPKQASDAGPRRRTLIVDDKKVVGESG